MKVQEDIAKKKMAKRTMKKMVEAVTKVTSEEYKQMAMNKFISDIQYSPKMKRLPPPADIYSPSYDALLYLKGIPFKATENDVYNWLKKYDIISVVFIKNENGFFTGDAYVRCVNIGVRDRVAKEMQNKTIGGRFIQVFRISENPYLEYYHSGHRKEPKLRNYIDPSLLVITNNQLNKLSNPKSIESNEENKDSTLSEKSFINNVNSEVDLKDIRTGTRLVGTVTEMYRNGVMVDCNVFETRNGVREKVFCVLKRNRIAKNIGLQGQQHEWLRMKDLVLFPGIKLNLYVEKIRSTTSKNTFDQDLWNEHFHDSLISSYFNTVNFNNYEDNNKKEIDSPGSDTTTDNREDNIEVCELNTRPFATSESEFNLKKEDKRALVYLTMDSSVSEDKVLWWEKKILKVMSDKYMGLKFENQTTKSVINYEVNKERVLNNKVKTKEIYQGKSVVYGNQPNEFTLDSEKEENILKNLKGPIDSDSTSDERVLTDETNEEKVKEKELPNDIPIGELLYGNSKSEPDEKNVFILDKDVKPPQKNVEFVDLNYQKLVNQFFKNIVNEKDIHFHDFDPELQVHSDTDELYLSDDEMADEDDRSADFNWIIDNDNRKNLEAFPRLTLYDPAIKLPPNGLILRESEVPKLSGQQIENVLELLGKESKETYEENKDYLIEVIRKEGLPNDLLPQTLIQKGLYKVKQSKEYMKKIVNITKELTGRKFSRRDLDEASTEELEMLVEEALYKFLNWNPPFDIKKHFISNYRHMLDDNITLPKISEVVPNPEFMKENQSDIEEILSETSNSVVDPNDENVKKIEKMWNDMKWFIVIFIYGEQSDLKEIVKQLEKDKIFQEDPAIKCTPMEVESLLLQSNED